MGVALSVALATLAFLMFTWNTWADETVPTSASVTPSSDPPIIECKWELPDMDSGTAGIQYIPANGNDVHDDDMATVPDADNDPSNGIQVPCSGPPDSTPLMPQDVQHMIQVRPNLEDQPEERRIQLWMAAEHPNGISNISDVYWEIYHPDGTKKVQVHGTKLTPEQCDDYGTGTGPVGSMFEAAVHTGQMTDEAVDDVNKGFIALCQQELKGLYYAEFSLSKDQMCGEYEVRASAVASGGAVTTLVNYIDVFCIFALTLDFDGVNWGSITPGSTKVVGGDLIFDSPVGINPPTVKNIGNDGMGLRIRYSELVGANFGKIIDLFDAKYGRSPSTLLSIDPIPADTWADFGAAAAQVLCANELGKLDLSIHPPSTLPADTYSGEVRLQGYHVPDECRGNTHII